MLVTKKPNQIKIILVFIVSESKANLPSPHQEKNDF